MTEEATFVSGSLSAQVRDEDGVVVVHLAGEFDMAGAPTVEQQITSALRPNSQLVVDLTSVTFMDSSGLGVLARTKHLCDEQETQLTVRIGDSAVRRVLDLAGLNEHLNVQD